MSKIPDTHQPTLCLCMIVKNEAKVIARALASAMPHIDYWIICDTGSTDGTPDIVQSMLGHIPGELHHTAWKNFGHNRTEVLRLARQKTDYSIVMDADMILNVKAPFRHKLIHHCYEIRYEGPVDYCQPMLVSNAHDWRYVGVTHEYIDADTASSWDFLPEVTLTHFGDGGCRSDKFERDIALLTKGLEEEPENVRYMFYLAQSHKDLGHWADALEWYNKRIAAGSWEEEKWYAMYQAAEMKRRLGLPWPEVQQAYLAAFDERPARLEPLYAIAKHYRKQQQYFQGYVFAAVALQGLPYPAQDKLFIDKPVYDYLLLLECIACSLACGRVSETIEGANMILRQPELPAHVYGYAVEARTLAGKLLKGKGNADANANNRLVVIVPFYNAGALLDECVQSLLQQDYERFEVIFIDDASTDRHKDFTPPAALDAQLIRNTKRRGAARNLQHAIMTCCEPDDIVVCLDGDDRLSCRDALSYINAQYRQHDCWVMYGQYADSEGVPGVSEPFASPKDFGTLRTRWRCSHIKTFRAGLFQRIAEQDPSFACLKDAEGKWLQSATDAAIMFPLMEMAGFYRVLFNEKILYIYNRHNPLSHHHADAGAQADAYDRLCMLRPFARVKHYQPAAMPALTLLP